MAQSSTNFRAQQAALAAASAKQIVDGFTGLGTAAKNMGALRVALAGVDPAAGTFQDVDFSDPGLIHLTPALMGQLFGPLLTLLSQFADEHIDPNDPNSPTVNDILRACTRGKS